MFNWDGRVIPDTTQKSEILTSSHFKNALVEKNTAAANKVKAANNKKKATSNKSKSVTTNNKKMKTKQNIQTLTKDRETECIICGENFDENWIQCFTCKDWAHEACVDIDPSKSYYYCDVCKFITNKSTASNSIFLEKRLFLYPYRS